MADNPVAALARGTSALEISEHSHWPLEFSPPQGMERGPRAPHHFNVCPVSDAGEALRVTQRAAGRWVPLAVWCRDGDGVADARDGRHPVSPPLLPLPLLPPAAAIGAFAFRAPTRLLPLPRRPLWPVPLSPFHAPRLTPRPPHGRGASSPHHPLCLTAHFLPPPCGSASRCACSPFTPTWWRPPHPAPAAHVLPPVGR